MTPQALPSFRFETAQLAAGDRLDAWQAVLGGVCTVLPGEGCGAADCQTSTDAWHLGRMVAADLRLNSQSHARTGKHIRADQMDHYRLALKVEGRQTCDVGDRLESLTPGSLLLVDQAQPECSHFHTQAGRNLVFYLPREPLDELLSRPLDLHGRALRGGMAGLVADHLGALVRHLPRMRAADAPAATAATLQLVAAAIEGSAQACERARPAIESSTLRQACRYVELHLGEADLSADSMAGFFRISRPTLYRLFEPLGGVANYIKERRLLRIHALLANAERRLQVQRLAEDHGFKTATHLSREFRRLFGYSPTQARGQVAVPVLPGATDGNRMVAFHSWVRAMRD